MLERYNKCIFCGSSRFELQKNQRYLINFYLKAIISDLKISKSVLNKIKVFKCKNCHILQNNPWFNKSTCRRIYSNIYGQHHRAWTNLINFTNKQKLPNHGKLFSIINNNMNIKSYAEFNSPFMGLFFNFFKYELKNKGNINLFSKSIINYLTSRQVAGVSQASQNNSIYKAKKALEMINNFKKRYIKKKVLKYLFVDNSILSWGQNDNYKSINSKSFASELFDIEIMNLKKLKKKLDLFGIFHTLDHTFEPKKIFNFALNNSKCVVIYCHIDERLNKQHLFSITKDFLKYLKKEKIYATNLTNHICKKYSSPELYFICSKQKKHIDKFISHVHKK